MQQEPMFDNSDMSERIETVRQQRTDQLLTCNICSKMLYSCKSRGKTGFSSAKTLLSIFSKGTASRVNRNRNGKWLKISRSNRSDKLFFQVSLQKERNWSAWNAKIILARKRPLPSYFGLCELPKIIGTYHCNGGSKNPTPFHTPKLRSPTSICGPTCCKILVTLSL
jgi:hypothetical protein